MPLQKTIGVGGSNAETELDKLSNMTGDIQPIKIEEYNQRIDTACSLMRELGHAAIYLNAGTNLLYFTGTKWGASCLLYTSPSPRDLSTSRMPSSA